jgi:hypothetical protein
MGRRSGVLQGDVTNSSARDTTPVCASVLSPERVVDLSGTSNSTPSYMERVTPLAGESAFPESAFSSEIPMTGMERLWNVMKKGLLAGDTLR